MNKSDLSTKSQATLDKLAKSSGMKPGDVLRHILAISSHRKVSKHGVLFCGPRVSKHQRNGRGWRPGPQAGRNGSMRPDFIFIDDPQTERG